MTLYLYTYVFISYVRQHIRVIVYPSNMRSAVQVEGNDLEHESHKGQRTQRSVESGGEAQGFYFGVTREPHDARGVDVVHCTNLEPAVCR